MLKIIAALLIFLAIAFSQTERWVYRYNGPGNYNDEARSIIVDLDNNLYAAGISDGGGSYDDFTVISLNSNGDQRWVYRYNGPGNSTDYAHSLAYGNDGNIYAAGVSTGISTVADFTVISLTPSGNERWVYRYDGSGDGGDWASSVVYGIDDIVYAAGVTHNDSTSFDFTVISLTSNGDERWVYTYNGPGNYWDWANSIIYGEDGNIYAAGYSTGNNTSSDFTVISLSPNGTGQWVYRYNGPGDTTDEAYSLVYGADSNIYIVGYSYGINTREDFTVISLTENGDERWVYRYNGSGNYSDIGSSIVYGTDGNVYASGRSCDSNISYDFIVLSLTANSNERWAYRYSGQGFYQDGALSLVNGADNNIYAAGFSESSSTSYDFTIISLSQNGVERWLYKYNGPGNSVDAASSIINGPDGNVYAAGSSYGSGTFFDFTIISINPAIGIEEYAASRNSESGFHISLGTIQNQKLNYTLSLPEPAKVNLYLYNTSGQKVLNWQVNSSKNTSHCVKNLTSISPGVYFLRAEVQGKGAKYNKKIVIMR